MSLLAIYRDKIGHLVEDDVWNHDLPNVRIDNQTKELTKCLAGRFRGSVRISSGLFYTDEELLNEKKRLLGIKLP